MEESTKELVPANEIHLSPLMEQLAKTLAGRGPALGFGRIQSSKVPQRVAVVVPTSGTSGSPKEVGLSAAALIASATASNKYLRASIGQVWSLLLPLTHIAGVNVLIRSLQLGTTPIDLRSERKDPKYPKADFTAIVPTQLYRALNGDDTLFNHLKNCKAVLVGGAALSPSLATEARDRGINIVTTYGMSETSGGCVYDGQPLDGIQVEIENGLVKVKGPNLATTYVNDEHEWRKHFSDGWFSTKDRGEIEAGKIQILGRNDEIINSGGEKISLSMIESTLESQFPSAQFAAFGVKEEEWGDVLHLAVANGEAISDEVIELLLSQAFGNFAKPKKIIRLNSLPRTDLGKIDRAYLQTLIENSEAK